MKIWPFSRRKTQEVATQELIAQLLYRLDTQDQQLHRMERAMEDQAKRIEKLMRRIDQATGRGAA